MGGGENWELSSFGFCMISGSRFVLCDFEFFGKEGGFLLLWLEGRWTG